MSWYDQNQFYRNSLWTEMDRLQREMNNLFSGTLGYRNPATYPPVNIWTNEAGVKVTAELPGISAENLAVSVEGGTLIISGNHEAEKLCEGEDFHRNERRHGNFSRSINLPFKVEHGKVNADYKDGILTIALPRAEDDKPKRIEIKAA